MAKKIKRETVQLPPLCAAVKSIRAAYGETQEEFGRRVGVTLNTVARYEAGRMVPTDFNVLGRLARAAREIGSIAEAGSFVQAQNQIRFRAYRGPFAEAAPPLYPPQEWRLMQAARIAVRLYPENARAVEEAAGPALALVDEILRTAPATVFWGPHFYDDLEQQINELADRRAFDSLKQERNK